MHQIAWKMIYDMRDGDGDGNGGGIGLHMPEYENTMHMPFSHVIREGIQG